MTAPDHEQAERNMRFAEYVGLEWHELVERLDRAEAQLAEARRMAEWKDKHEGDAADELVELRAQLAEAQELFVAEEAKRLEAEAQLAESRLARNPADLAEIRRLEREIERLRELERIEETNALDWKTKAEDLAVRLRELEGK